MRTKSSARSSAFLGGLAVAVVAYAWCATGLRPFSLPATAAVVGAGGVAMIAGAQVLRRRARTAGVRARELVPWLVLFGALAVVQLTAFFQTPRDEHPTLSYLTNLALETHAARAIAFVAWVVGAARLARR